MRSVLPHCVTTIRTGRRRSEEVFPSGRRASAWALRAAWSAFGGKTVTIRWKTDWLKSPQVVEHSLPDIQIQIIVSTSELLCVRVSFEMQVSAAGQQACL